jgi:hypothetical protein
VHGMCSNFDVFPTILTWFGIKVPDDLDAVSLQKLDDGDVAPDSRLLLTEQLYFGVEQKGVSTDTYRYIFHTADGSEELYNVSDDPGMKTDIASDRRATSRNFRYFVTEYTLNAGTGWHIRASRAGADWTGPGIYKGTITAPSGIAEVKPTRIGPEDTLDVNGNVLTFSLQVDKWTFKAFDFKTNDENDQVQFAVYSPDNPAPEGYIFIGPEKELMPSSEFTLSILDPRFGLGMPVFGQSPGHDGFHVWGNSVALHEKVTPEIDERTLEALKSLGYLN